MICQRRYVEQQVQMSHSAHMTIGTKFLLIAIAVFAAFNMIISLAYTVYYFNATRGCRRRCFKRRRLVIFERSKLVLKHALFFPSRPVFCLRDWIWTVVFRQCLHRNPVDVHASANAYCVNFLGARNNKWGNFFIKSFFGERCGWVHLLLSDNNFHEVWVNKIHFLYWWILLHFLKAFLVGVSHVEFVNSRVLWFIGQDSSPRKHFLGGWC